MLMMIVELLTVGFILGLCITAAVLASITGVELLLRITRTHAGHPPTELRPRHPASVSRRGSGQSRAA